MPLTRKERVEMTGLEPVTPCFKAGALANELHPPNESFGVTDFVKDPDQILVVPLCLA